MVDSLLQNLEREQTLAERLFDTTEYTTQSEHLDFVTSQQKSVTDKGLLPDLAVFIKDPCEKIETPVDSNGLVDADRLIKAVKSFVPRNYKWRGEADDHHLYWFGKIYSTANLFMQNEPVGRTFRTSPIHVIEFPREFHNLVHLVSLPVEAPSLAVMEYRNESWRVALTLFNKVKTLKHYVTLTNEEAARLVHYESTRSVIEEELEAVAALPEEFRFFETNAIKRIVRCRRVKDIRYHDLNRAQAELRHVGKVKRHGALKPNSSFLSSAS